MIIGRLNCIQKNEITFVNIQRRIFQWDYSKLIVKIGIFYMLFDFCLIECWRNDWGYVPPFAWQCVFNFVC